ncbi:MAG: hypothetical protein ACI8QD_002379 [Cyclobacteriaceae bacterium]|jgi:hypothetical protein
MTLWRKVIRLHIQNNNMFGLKDPNNGATSTILVPFRPRRRTLSHGLTFLVHLVKKG